jgi:hypothetical protein
MTYRPTLIFFFDRTPKQIVLREPMQNTQFRNDAADWLEDLGVRSQPVEMGCRRYIIWDDKIAVLFKTFWC